MKNIERPHIPDEELHAYCDGELSPTQRMEIAEHLLGCLICRAQHDDVESLRARTTALLELASPPAIRRRVASPAPVPARRRDAPRIAAAIAAAVVGTGVWFSLRPDRVVNPDSQLATSLLTPSLGVALPDANPAGQRARQITISNRVTGVPGVLALHHAPVASFPRSVAAAAVDPVLGDDWPESALDSIVRRAVARIEGLTVTSIRTHRSDGSTGARPTSLVREQLPDGRSIWIFEGLEEDFADVSDILQATGINVSIPIRTRPDYISGPQAHPMRTVRMAAVAGYLPADSLNALMNQVEVP